jgi:hypothetical protein
MGEVIPFISRAERERIRRSDPLTEQREESSVSAANVRRGDEALP